MESEMNNNFSFDLPKNKSNVIKVIGVGGGGSNAINYMFQQGINGVDFVVTNTDAQALNESSVPIKIQLGASLTEGLGAGANPKVGALAAEESFEDIKTLLTTQTKMVFITAGMGGGTGTGAAPIIAKMAKEMDVLTVGIVTMPFQFEGKLRLEQAEKGLENLKKTVDALIVINNNKLREVYGNLGFKAGFSKADEVLSTAARGIAEVITHHYRQNIDLKDAKTVLKDSGTAIMGSGSASGTNRAHDAIINALDSPLLNDNKITGCKNVLLLIVSGNEEITIDEIGEINDFIQTEAGNNANIIMGIGEDQKLESSVSVTIIATGFGADQQHQIVNTEAKKIIHTLEEDQTLEHNLMGSEVNSDPFEIPHERGVKKEIENEVEEEIGEEPTPEKEETTTNFMLDEKEEVEEEDLFSIPVVAEIVSGYEAESEMMEAEKIEAEEVESEDELIAITPAIENMEVVYEILEYDQPEEALEIETEEEEFIINDLDEQVLDLEVVGSEEVEAEEENQFAFDFGLPISDNQEVSAEKIVHTLSEAEEEEVKEDASLSEAIDFEFEVVEKREEIPVTDMEEVMSSPHDDSPFDKKIKETATKENEERKEHLKKFNHAFKHSVSKIDEFEKQPAYKRMGLELDQPSSSESNESRLSVDSDKNDDIQLRSNNSFLHDNVD
ncbi:MAG: cell division protein FtsZ [Flavobacteriaceae bacterium]|jgi:cell division protein FtsZ|nr:cell division protein FtsZ [Flavobacteriaceae bacterium]MBT6128398.1 cell division protein FtsZ [Flavobacteriaceae bacterium]